MDIAYLDYFDFWFGFGFGFAYGLVLAPNSSLLNIFTFLVVEDVMLKWKPALLKVKQLQRISSKNLLSERCYYSFLLF